MKLKLAYFGTPDFSATLLEKILEDKTIPVEVRFVVTRPDKPVGRKKKIMPSPVKSVAQRYNIQAIYDLKEALLAIQKNKVDLALLFAYGRIIKKDLLQAPKHGFWNIHPSLLPLYRGASPVAYPLMLGDTKTGVTIIQMDEKLDHGPIIAQEETAIIPHETRPELTNRLADIAFEIVSNLLKSNIDKLKLSPQNHKKATFTKIFNKNDGFIEINLMKRALDNNKPPGSLLPEILRRYLEKYSQVNKRISAQIVYDLFRSMHPWPGIWTKATIKDEEKRLLLHTIILINDKLIIKRVQLEGKKKVDFNTFTKAYPGLL